MNRAPQFLLLECPGSGRMLAFGLRWFALIGSNVPALARARARRLRATHYVVGGAPATVAGYGRAHAGWRRSAPARASRQKGGAHLQSAAQLFALLYPDGGYSLVRLPDGRQWLVAAHGGTVLSQTDRVFGSLEEALPEQRALLAQRPALKEHAAGEVWAALLQATEPGARLAALPTRWAELPLALRLFLVCVGLAAAVPPLWNTVAGSLFRPAPAKPESVTVRELQEDAHQAMLRGTAAHAPAELARLLAGVGRLPIQVRGWALRRAQCDAGAQQWNCSAVYARAHPLATNDGLHALLPAGWRVSFKPLEEATLTWRMASGAISLADLALPSALHVDTQVAGALQRLRPAFASMALSPPAPMQPRTQAPAQANAARTGAAPADLPIVRRRALTMHGPLRSMALLPGPIPAARWSRLVVDVQPQLRPSLAASTLVAELQGDLYEQE
ncbi:hypothetical protein ACFWP0_20250 [Achromobacter sp. NPDC058515]|uniref:hypothetical protein n=1 Tax=Achromobacter sp. NPDC058515 TaxID=3346533 RepID=UPI003668F75F